MKIIIDDLTKSEIRDLLTQHFAEMQKHSPCGSCHYLDFDGLRKPDVTFWSIWNDDELAGCGALKELEATHGEIKSMRTHDAYLRQGVGSLMLKHIIAVATERGYQRLSLETGSGSAFEPASKMYERFGFTECPPFGNYVEDPFSRFFTLGLGSQSLSITT